MKISPLALAAALAVTTTPVAANAAIYLITYTGTISNGYDETGVFGAANTYLTNAAFTAIYTLTDPTPGAFAYIGGIESATYGGTGYGVAAFPVSATIKINGITKAIAGTYSSLARQRDGYPSQDEDRIDHSAANHYDDGINYRYNSISSIVRSSVNNIVNSSNYTDPLNYTLQAGDIQDGQFGFIDGIFAPGAGYITKFNVYAFGYLNITSVTIAPVSAVPEPATWAMLLAGFGFVGGAMRYRPRRPALTR